MTKAKTIEVTIEKREKSGLYVATSGDMPELLVMSESEDKVIADIPTVIALIQRAKEDRGTSENQETV